MKFLIAASGQAERVVRSRDDLEAVEYATGVPLASWKVLHAFPSGVKERKLARRWPPPDAGHYLHDYLTFVIDDPSNERIALFDWLRDHGDERIRETEELLHALPHYEIEPLSEPIPDGWEEEDTIKVRGKEYAIIRNRRTPHRVAKNPLFVAGVAGVLLFAALELYSGTGRSR